MKLDQMLYTRINGHGFKRAVTLPHATLPAIAEMLCGIIAPKLKGTQWTLDLSVNPFPEDGVMIDDSMSVRLNGSNPMAVLEGEQPVDYTARTVPTIHSTESMALNYYDIISPTPTVAGMNFRDDSAAQRYREYQASQKAWDTLMPLEQQALRTHMETNYEGTRFWDGTHRR